MASLGVAVVTNGVKSNYLFDRSLHPLYEMKALVILLLHIL
jgi:hypothetical protein